MSPSRRFLLFLLLNVASAAAQAQLTPITGSNDVQAGLNHACALSTGGGLRCWGDNSKGQLGNGSTEFTDLPVDVSGLSSGVTRVALGAHHTCALLGTGDVKCWGDNQRGQLGDGSTTSSALPVTVQSLGAGVTGLALGDVHSCAVFGSGSVMCWGDNSVGQLGTGATSLPPVPTPVNVASITGAQSISSFDAHTCALLSGGFVQCWGLNTFGQLGDGTTTLAPAPVSVLDAPGGTAVSGYQMVAAGFDHTCAINGAGGAVCWGRNIAGALGNDDVVDLPNPVAVTGLASGVQGIDAGWGLSCAKLSGGVIKCWGDNSFGQVGDGTSAGYTTNSSVASRLTPVSVSLQQSPHQVAAGGYFACARTVSTVQCWGHHRFGQLGDGRQVVFPRASDVPGAIGLQSGVAKVYARANTTCALLAGGSMQCWGANHFGSVGDGTYVVRTSPAAVQNVANVQSASVGYLHACARLGDGTARCWGSGELGALGNNTFVDAPVPTTVLDAGGVSALNGITGISTGGSHTCAVRSDTGIKCWGNRGFGRLGDGLTSPRAILPVDVLATAGGSPLLGFAAVSLGQNHSCGLTTTGGVKCWGRNDNGRLGDDTNIQRSIPVDVLDNAGVAPLAGIAAVSAGSNHTCALTTAGTVKCWGFNSDGQLGDGSLTDRFRPVDVTGLPPGVNEIGGGGEFTCARNGGQVRCWGDNFVGQLGDGTVTDSSTPVLVLDIGDAAQMAVGYENVCVVTSAGAVRCWGFDQAGLLGFGNRTFALPGDVRVFEAPRMVEPVTPAGDNASVAPQSDAQGRYIVFQSAATNLIGGDANGGSDIYIVDRDSGNAVRASVNNDGSEAGGGAVEPTVTADGQAVSFVAPDAAITKVFGESKAAANRRTKQGTSAIFLRNLITGTTQRLGVALPSTSGSKPRLSAGGKAIVYTAINTDPAQGAVGQQNVYRIPLAQSGDMLVPQPTECVSCQARSVMGAAAGAADGESGNAVVSADGRFVVYETKAGNAVVGAPAPCPNAQVMLRDMVLGFAQRLSPPPGVTGVNCGTAGSTVPSIDWAGRNVTFVSDSVLKPGTLPGNKSVFAGAIGTTNFDRLSETDGGSNPDGESGQPVFAGDGDTVVFVSDATNLDPSFADTNAVGDVYARRRAPSGSLIGGRAQRMSRTVTGAEANAPANRPAVNYNATLLVFDSAASNLVAGDANGQVDVYQRAVPVNADVVFGAGFE